MQKALVEAKQEIIELKQYSRSQNVEIKGIPVVPDENLRKSVVKMATFVGVNISEDDIDVVHRVRSKDKDRPNVVLRFCTRAVRDKFFSAARKAKLTARALGFEESNPVYVNEHLCIEIKVLLSKARQLSLEKKWKFAWISQGKILMRKTETSTVLRIESESDLAQIV